MNLIVAIYTLYRLFAFCHSTHFNLKVALAIVELISLFVFYPWGFLLITLSIHIIVYLDNQR